MGNIFNSSKKPAIRNTVTDEDRAILALKMQRDKMKMAYKRHENNIVKEKEMARKLLSEGRKDRALLILKRKRFTETLMDKIMRQLNQIEKMVLELETVQLNQAVFERLKEGNEALQKLNEAFSVEDVEKIMEETREAQVKQEEISSILSSNLTLEDLEAIDEEYEQLIREQLPEVPSHLLPVVEERQPAEKKSTKQKTGRVALEAS